MPYKYDDDEIDYRIIESFGKFSKVYKSWAKEINLISWNGRAAKLDIRNWQTDHKKCGKGITLNREEAEELYKLLGKILNRKSEQNTGTKTKKQKIAVPASLEPFYDELELTFGADPVECKSARNTLLKKYHPDKNAANIAFATRKTIKIKEAYERIIAWWGGSR